MLLIEMQTKKENLSTPIGEQAPINTQEASSGTIFSKIIISSNYQKVNISQILSSKTKAFAAEIATNALKPINLISKRPEQA